MSPDLRDLQGARSSNETSGTVKKGMARAGGTSGDLLLYMGKVQNIATTTVLEAYHDGWGKQRTTNEGHHHSIFTSPYLFLIAFY